MREEFILFKSTGEIVLEAVQLKNNILGAHTHTQSAEKAEMHSCARCSTRINPEKGLIATYW